jgi:hypothetical protein
VASKITSTTQHLSLFLFLFWLNAAATAEEQKPPTIKPFEIPTFTGKPVDWNHQKPAINPLPKIDGDAIFKVVNRCYPLKSGFGLDISLKAGATYKDTANSTQINTLDSNKYYAGIVANMPLYSDVEIDKDRKLEYQRRMQTTDTIKALLTGVATKRRAERLMGLYEALEKRAQERIKNGLAETAEQITFLEKVATTQGELDQANASIEASRLALIGQCRPDAEQEVNDYILNQIK